MASLRVVFLDVFLKNQLDDQFRFSKDKDIDLGCEKCSVVHNPKTDIVHLTMDSLPIKEVNRTWKPKHCQECIMVIFPAFVDASSSASVMQG